MCEQCKQFRWYAEALASELRKQAEFAETDAERQTKLFGAHSVDLVFGEWGGKFNTYPDVPYRPDRVSR